jgi:hypothetical protein
MKMDGIGLTRDEFADLRTEPASGADQADRSAAIERQRLFPMNLAAASSHLRGRGYDCRPAMLELLIENGVVAPAAPGAWTRADVDAAAEHFEQWEIFTPYAAMCQTLGCRYADFLRPLREAAERESRKHGRRIPDDDQYFVMHRMPPRGAPDAHVAIITFTLADDVRERLERGEDV